MTMQLMSRDQAISTFGVNMGPENAVLVNS